MSATNLLTPRLKELVTHYNRPGPRYTSYPTAPEWQEDFQPKTLQEKLLQLKTQQPQTPISLYVHIPFCKEICHFCGCNTFKSSNPAIAERYLDYLIREITMFASYLPEPRQSVQMHWGGGTPTYLSEKQIERLYVAIQAHFKFSNDAEISIELDPRVTSDAQTRLLRQLGFNRVSFGVQDNDPAVQKASNRIQPIEVTQHLYDLCRQLGFSSINFDLIYGLPLQTTESFEKTVRSVVGLHPDRIALFSYAHVPWLKPFQKKINEQELPDPDTKFSTFLMAREQFMKDGYEPIGMDHFAVPNDELAIARRQLKLRRNFQGYTVKPETHVYAFGISAISDFGDLYVQNIKKFNTYYERIDAGDFAVQRGYHLDENDRLRRQIITQLLCNFELVASNIENEFHINFADYFSTELLELSTFVEEGLLQITPPRPQNPLRLTVTPLGQLFIRNICMIFDDHLRSRQGESRQMFSKTV